MTIDLLIHAIVRQTTILIAQLATSRGIRAPLAQIADQVFLELVGELERQRVSRKVSADMFGLGLRTYRRKIQRLSESSTEQGRSLWEVVLEYLRGRNQATRVEVLQRFRDDDEAQVKAVLYDLCQSQLVFPSGMGPNTTYRAASRDELVALEQGHGAEDSDELLLALMFGEGHLTLADIGRLAKLGTDQLSPILERLQAEGRLERTERDGTAFYRATTLVIPLGSAAGWEAAMFNHFKAMVTTLICRLRQAPATPNLSDQVGGSTYTIDIWPGHPLADEVLGTLGRYRAELSDLRKRIRKINDEHGVADAHIHTVIYMGQCQIHEGHERTEQPE
jgi:hypothetical protein